GRLAGGFGTVDLDDAAAGKTADAQRDVEAERSGRYSLDLDERLAGAEPHDRALAKGAFDLRERRGQRFFLVHTVSFNEAKCCFRHRSYSFSYPIPFPRPSRLSCAGESPVGNSMYLICSFLQDTD